MCSRLGGSLMDQRDEDWRDTLFYWHGKVSWVGGERNVMTWRGTWLSSVSSHMPPAADFAASFNFFELNFDVDAERAQHLARGHTDLELFRGLRGEFRGHYLMEPPDGTGYRRAYRDDSHQFHIETHLEDPPPEVQTAAPPPPPGNAPAPPFAMFVVPQAPRQPRLPGPYALVAARGSNEFGTFVSLGHARRARSGADDSVELTLARRYVRDDDSRWRWPLEDLVKHVTAPPRVAPWEHSLPCRLPADIMAADALAQPEPVDGGRPAHQSAAYDAMMARKRRRA